MNKRNGFSKLDKIVMAGINAMDAAIEQSIRKNEINFINEILVPSIEYYYRLKSRFVARNNDPQIKIIPDINQSEYLVKTQKGILYEVRNGQMIVYNKIISGYPALWPNAKSGRNCMRDD